MKTKIAFRALLGLLLILLIAVVQGRVVVADGEEDTRNSNPDIIFSAALPSSLFRTFTAPAGGADVAIFARDCCIRDDVVEIYVDGCLLATVDSRAGAFGTHAGETHTVSVAPGLHTVEYRNIISSVGPSGWSVSETLKSFTGIFPCGCDPTGASTDSITDGTCGPTGLKSSVEDESGNKIQLRCVDIPGAAPEFHLEYVNSGGASTRRVGRCPWGGGQNNGRITNAGDSDGDGKFDCFLNTFWRSREPGLFFAADQGELNTVDWMTYEFDAQSGELVLKYFTSPDGPGWLFPDKLKTQAVNVDPQDFNPDPPVGSDPMVLENIAPCDNDLDGDCDAFDFEFVTAAIGATIDGDNYNEPADADHDGLVTLGDQHILFPVVPVRINIKPSSDPNSIDLEDVLDEDDDDFCEVEIDDELEVGEGVLAVAILSSPAFDALTVDDATVELGDPTLSGALMPLASLTDDVDRDGDEDLLLLFCIPSMIDEGALNTNSTELVLTGETSDGRPVQGSDSVLIVVDDEDDEDDEDEEDEEEEDND